MCTPKHITSRLVMGLPYDQKTAMRRTRYAPYPVVNAIFDKPVYNRGYDTWCPGNSFTDFIVADWTDPQHSRLSPETQHSLVLYAAARNSARPRCSKKTIAKRSPPACSPISRNYCRNSTSIPSKCASTAAAIPCSWRTPGPVHKKSHRRRASHGPHLFRQQRFRRPGIAHQRSHPFLARRRRMGGNGSRRQTRRKRFRRKSVEHSGVLDLREFKPISDPQCCKLTYIIPSTTGIGCITVPISSDRSNPD